MDLITEGFLILLLIFLLEAFLYNVLKPDLPKIPGDLWIEKPGITLYIPFVSALVLAVIAVLFLQYFSNLF